MKKIIIFVSLIVVVLVIGTAAAFAGDGFHGRNFTDANGDGVCDNYVTGQCGAGFTDADGDGICDNRENDCGAHLYHHGSGHGQGGGHRYCAQ